MQRRGFAAPVYAACAWLAVALFAQDAPHVLGALPQTAEAVFATHRVQEGGRLSDADTARYRALWQAQDSGEWKEADTIAATLAERSLMGHVLAERYLDNRYVSGREELKRWLGSYADHPQAASIRRLAVNKFPQLAGELPRIRAARAFGGFGDDRRPMRARNPAQWDRALNVWKTRDYAAAAEQFEAIIRTTGGDGEATAAHFWAWRSLDALGETTRAETHLKAAAADERGFYGILAQTVLGETPLATEPATKPFFAFDTSSRVAERARALSITGRTDLAEAELRYAFPRADKAEKEMLLETATALHFATLQQRMARELVGRAGGPYLAALYPTPGWHKERTPSADPALTYAIAKQESGFDTDARSPRGATGVMQLMPATARSMARSLREGATLPDADAKALTEPLVNVTLGESYVKHLMDQPWVGNRLTHVLAAYNAGPGKLLEWQKSGLLATEDPLEFIERIPYAETRHYVQRVLTNYWAYSALLHETPVHPETILSGEWPSYAGIDALATQSMAGAVTALNPTQAE